VAAERLPDFGPLAETYDQLRPIDENWWELFEVLVEEGDFAGRRTLDVGSGTGRLAAALADRGARVWGIDPSDEMLREARTLAGRRVGFKKARAEALPFKDAWFERAVLRLVVHLVERPRTFRELVRVLGADGRLVIATFAPDHFEWFWLASYFPEVGEIDRARFPTPDGLASELEAAGFADLRVRTLAQRARLTRDEALERIRGRYISTLQLLDGEAYATGLARAERGLPEELETRLDWAVLAAVRGRAA
jgi:SAM-dependent methyltransferase